MSEPNAPDASLDALARRVKSLRENLRLTQEEFARKIGISVSFASLLERGERAPSYETLVAVAHALDVPLGELFRDGMSVQPEDPSHTRLLDFARKAHLSRQQVDLLAADAGGTRALLDVDERRFPGHLHALGHAGHGQR